MIITMSDYLLEQEISTANCGNIVMEQLQAEIDVAGAILEAYTKQLVMLEYTSDEKFYQEADANKPGFFKRIGEGLKKLWDGFWEMLKRWFGNIKRFFTGTTLNQTMSKMEKMSDEDKAYFRLKLTAAQDGLINNLEAIIDKILGTLDDIVNKIPNVDLSKSETVGDIESMLKEAADSVKRYFGNSEGTSGFGSEKTLNYQQAMDLLKKFKDKSYQKQFEDKLADASKKITQAKAAVYQSMDDLFVGTKHVELGVARKLGYDTSNPTKDGLWGVDIADPSNVKDSATGHDATRSAIEGNRSKVINAMRKFVADLSKVLNSSYNAAEEMMTKLIKEATKDVAKNKKTAEDVIASQKRMNLPEADTERVDKASYLSKQAAYNS